MVRLKLEGVGVTFSAGGGDIRALDDVDLALLEGEIATIVGPSGSGKTTLLRVAAGLEEPDSGRATRREGTKLGFVFQEPRLLGSLTARGNIALGLGSRRAEREGARRVDEIVELLGLREHRNAYPPELSGGIAQRVSLGRALVRDPDLLLMDEPFSALDAPLRGRLQEELLAILAPRRTSALFVTHDLVEALRLGDRVIALRAGRIVRTERIDWPRPRDQREARFVGLMDSLAVTLGGSPRKRGAEPEYHTQLEENSA
jgi:sulfonate transport system ATP-binding protein